MSNLKNGPENGSMATNMEEVKLLGKQMEKLRDVNELEQDNRVSDPAQSDATSSMKQRKND
ncbi:multidrug ABC transporter ATPase [Psychrobacillus sp. FSL H8-0483]|uniref:multidrug ABC transporter ATPase n=1 Tax=Psychrobacillus sp. FSL H8-0483 TaxID=2921389 RepID=UPI00315B0CD5